MKIYTKRMSSSLGLMIALLMHLSPLKGGISSLLGMGNNEVAIKVELDSASITKALNDMANSSENVMHKGLRGIGAGTGKGLVEGLQVFNEEMEANHTEIKENIASLVSKTDCLLDAKDGAFKQVSEKWFKLGNSIESDLYWQVVAPFFGKMSFTIAGTLILTVSAIYGTKVAWHWLEHQLYRPEVVTEYYNKNLINSIKNKLWRSIKPPKMILHSCVEERLNSLIKETQNTYKHIKSGKKNITFSNILLAGAPGTGKTMFAKRLAHESGMSYAFVSASSFFQEGAGIAAIKNLFKWAKKTKGLVLFIDEADALFVDRNKLKPDSEHYKIICEFLTYLGERSNTCMLVMATNYKVLFDQAMQSRIDDLIEMPLPDQIMREQIIALYVEQVLYSVSNGEPFIKSAQNIMTPACIQNIAHRTNGLSNRDLSALVNSIVKKAFANSHALVTTALVNQTVNEYIEKNNAFKKDQSLTL